MAAEVSGDLSGMMSTFQVKLNAFVDASEQAVANLSPKKNKKSERKSFIDRFRELPIEIRRVIYVILFENSKLTIPWCDVAPNMGGRSQLGCLSTSEIIERIDLHRAALLVAVEWCREEAIEILASQTTVDFTKMHSWNSERANLFEAVDPAFLKHVKKVQMPTINFIRSDGDALPELEEVCLTHRIYDVENHDDFSASLDHLFVCGDDSTTPPEEFALNDYEQSAEDLKWLQKQLLYLSKEKGWKLRFVTRWYPLRNLSDDQAWYEIEYAPDTLKVIKQGGVMKARSGEISGITEVEQLQQLQLVNTWCYICSL